MQTGPAIPTSSWGPGNRQAALLWLTGYRWEGAPCPPPIVSVSHSPASCRLMGKDTWEEKGPPGGPPEPVPSARTADCLPYKHNRIGGLPQPERPGLQCVQPAVHPILSRLQESEIPFCLLHGTLKCSSENLEKSSLRAVSQEISTKGPLRKPSLITKGLRPPRCLVPVRTQTQMYPLGA